MSDLPYLYGLLVALAGGLAAIAIASRRALWLRAGAVGLSALLFAGAYAGLADLLSRPKPVHLEWLERNAAQASVLAAAFREGEGIYLWLHLGGAAEPRAFVRPWNLDEAQALEEAIREGSASGGVVEFRRPFDLDYPLGSPRFVVRHGPSLPVKRLTEARLPTYYYQQPEAPEEAPEGAETPAR